jgi:Ras-related protein Rab-7A
LCYDLTNAASFDNLNRWKQGFIENAGPTDPASFPFVLLGNKLDQEATKREVATAKGQEWAKENNDMMFYETSALEGTSVESAFMQMARAALKRDQD